MSRTNKMLGVDEETVTRISAAFGIRSQKHCEVLGYMLRHDFTYPERLWTVLFAAEPVEPSANAVDHYMTELRPVLARNGVDIITVSGEGWTILREGKAKMRAMLDAVSPAIVADRLHSKMRRMEKICA